MNDSAQAKQQLEEQQVICDLASLDIASLEVEKYGVHPDQFIEWYGQDGRLLVLVHGGDLTENSTVDYLRPAAFALGEAGYRVALVEYRKVARHPEVTREDIFTLAQLPQLQDAIWIGHSTGTIFTLSLLFQTDISVQHCVAIAPVLDLRRETEENESFLAQKIIDWFGGSPIYLPDVYADYDPVVLYNRLGKADGFTAHGYRLDIIHGIEDATIPVQHTKDLQGEPFNIAIVPGASHSDVIRPGHDSWLFLLGALG